VDAGSTAVQVERLQDCENHATATNQDQCIALRISCGGLAAADVHLRVWAPTQGTTVAGTLVLGMGGTGTDFVVPDNSNSVQGRMMEQLVQRGYRAIERAWVDGWWGASTPNVGVAAPACRYVALIDWLADNLPETGPTCSFGNSGGSSEIGYALARHRLGDRIKLAVLGGGPPMARVDLGCAGDDAEPGWMNECARIWSEGQTECGRRPIKCGYNQGIKAVFDQSYGGSICSSPNANDLVRLRADSLVASNSTLDYPNTHVHVLHGRADCTEAPILGQLYYNEITSAKSQTRAAQTPHRTISEANGARDLLETVVQRCR
jgi:hypothetical protein